jgi:hypothetical protein
MMRLAILALLALAACGVDGEPTAPATGVSVGGDAYVGIEGKL